MRFGVCYYPEQWPEERWAPDAAAMAELGITEVRIGEFAWSRIEPARDRFDWGWLDRAIDTLAAAGHDVVLGTPTAAPPVWLALERPDILAVGPDGRPRAYGSRRHTSPSSRAYREEARRIVSEMVDRYGSHPAVVAWQIDNEPGNHDSARCWSAESQVAFSEWLGERYGSIDALNAAWGTAFWSGTYPSFDAVALPVPTVTDHHPSLLVAHLEFASEAAAGALAAQREIILAGAPGRAVFTNLYLGDIDVDPRAVARPCGLGAVDLYPHGVEGPEDVAFLLDLARGSALRAGSGPADRGGRAWVTEAQPGPVNWTDDNPAVAPGQVRLWAWQAALHGIEALWWFRWRAARSGQEQHHAALLRQDGSPGPAAAEVRRVVAEHARLERDRPGRLERPAARVALVHEHLDAWMLQVVPQVPGATHRQLVTAAHASTRRFGLDVDVVPADADLASYAVVLAPALHVATAERVSALHAALDAGSLVVLGPRSLVRDRHAVWVDRALPAGLSDALGATVDHAGSPAGWPRTPEHVSRVRVGDQLLDAGGWIETLRVHDDDVEVLALAEGGPLDGAGVAVRRGSLVHLGASSAEVWTAVLAVLLDTAPDAPHLVRYDRMGDVVLDHRRLHIEGLGAGVDG